MVKFLQGSVITQTVLGGLTVHVNYRTCSVCLKFSCK